MAGENGTPLAGTTPYTQSQTNSSGLASYAAPFTMDVLGRGQALTTMDPYHQYMGQRVAGFDPLQQQAGWSMSGLNSGNMYGQASNFATMGGTYQPSTLNFGQGQAQQYMSPYMQNVIDVSNNELARQSNIQGNYDDAKAAQAGAFGGSRQAIVDAERERNLSQMQNNNQLQGLQAAYSNAQGQFNQDQSRQQADAQYANNAALNAAGVLGGLGQQTFQNQLTAGQLGQNYRQQQLNNNYTDFQSAVRHPYDQLNFMNNLVKGLPGSTSTSTLTNTPTSPSTNWVEDLGRLSSGISTIGSIWDKVSPWFSGSGMAAGGVVQHGLGAGALARLQEAYK